MSIKSKYIDLLKSSIEMPYITEVEWLHNDYDGASSSVPYINTGIIANWDLPFEMTATVTKTTANRILLCGNYPNQLTFYIEITATNRVRFGSQNSTDADPSFVAFDIYTNSSYPVPLNVPTKIWVKCNPLNDAAHTVNYEIGIEALDGSVTRTETGSFYRAGTPVNDARKRINIFNDYRTAVTTFDGGFKLHQIDIKLGTEHKKFVACLDKNRIPAMYEQIEGKLYYNSGTGGFNAGRQINEVEWMHLTGKQYFNTGFKPNTLSTTLRTKYTFEGTAMMLGCRNAATYGIMCSIYMPVATTAYPQSRIRLDWMTGDAAIYTSKLTTDTIELEITGNYANVNGDVYTDTTKTSIDMDDAFRIGCAYTSNVSSHYVYPQTGKIYFDELLNTYTREPYRYCVPAHDENNVGFFFDRVNHFIMDNEGTGTDELTWGDEIHPVSYLYGGAPSRFNTGIVFYDHAWETDVRYNQVRTDLNLMGTTTGACNYWGVLNTDATYGVTYSLRSGSGNYGLTIDPSETRTVFLDMGLDTDNTNYKLSMTVEGENVVRTNSSANTSTGYRVTNFSNAYPEPAYLYGNRCYDRSTKEIIQNHIPVQNEKKIAYIFNTVNHTMTGTISNIDEFTKGADVIGYQTEPQLPYGFMEVDYLESTGTQYIDTGVYMNSNYGVEIEAKQPNSTTGTERYLFGDAPVSNRYIIMVTSGGTNYRCAIGASANVINASVSGYDGKFHTHKIENKTYYIDGTSQGSLSITDFTAGRTSRLFSVKTTLTLNNNYWQIRKCKIYNETGRIIADYVPCLRMYDKKPGMFDLISRNFLINDGTGEFLIGMGGVTYTVVNYLESTGTQYIDTGLYVDDTCGFYIDAETVTATDAIAIGTKGTGTSRWCYNPSTANMKVSWNTIYTAFTGSVLDRYKVKMNVFNDRQRSVNMTIKDAITEPLDKSVNKFTVCLFAAKWNDETPSLYWTGKLRACYMTKGLDYIGYYLPLVRTSDTKPGIYDTVSRTFLTNDGTGEFNYG